MPELGASGVTGVINGKLYVVSTCFVYRSIDHRYRNCADFGGAPSNLFQYDPGTDRWVRLPSPRYWHDRGGVLYGKLYVLGDGHFEIYDPATTQWTKRSTVVPNAWGPTAVQGAKLYMFGSWKTSAYDPGTNSWSDRAPTPDPQAVAASRVSRYGKPRIEVIGCCRGPHNNAQYIP